MDCLGFTGGGFFNKNNSCYGVIVGGCRNSVSCGTPAQVQTRQFIGGGQSNLVSGSASSIVGGQQNTSSGNYSFIGGGFNNTSSTDLGTIVGGENNRLNHNDSHILGSDIISHAVCTSHVNNLTVSGSTPLGNAVVIMRGLPTIDPVVEGQLWNNSGVLSVSSVP